MRQGFNGFPSSVPSTWVEKRRVFADSLNTKDLAEIAGILGCSGGATKVALPSPTLPRLLWPTAPRPQKWTS